MVSCVVRGCKNYDAKVKKKDGISYHRFPNDPVRSEIWSRIIRKQRNEPNFKPHKSTRICSAHFYDKDLDISKAGLRRLKGMAIPFMPNKPVGSELPLELDSLRTLNKTLQAYLQHLQMFKENLRAMNENCNQLAKVNSQWIDVVRMK